MSTFVDWQDVIKPKENTPVHPCTIVQRRISNLNKLLHQQSLSNGYTMIALVVVVMLLLAVFAGSSAGAILVVGVLLIGGIIAYFNQLLTSNKKSKKLGLTIF